MTELPSLPERPQADTFLVEDLLNEARRGRLRMPRFQRGLQWQSRHVRELFDSIIRGFPIGNLLLWSRDAPEETVRFGPVVFDVTGGQAHYIVDGQQRIAALVGALLHPDERPHNGPHAVWVDLESNVFLSGRQREKTDACVPLNILGERTKLLQWAREQRSESLVERAFEVSELLLRYKIPAYIVRDADERTLRRIFGRINASGVALSEADVFQALFGQGDDPKPIETIAAALNEDTNFGRLDLGWLLRCVKSVGGLPPHSDYTERDPPPSSALAQTQRALRRVIQFLQDDAGVYHRALMAYRLPLIVLARFFSIHPQPHPRNRALLVRWLWRGMLNGAHGQSHNNKVAKLEKLMDDDEDRTIQRLLDALGPLKSDRVADPSQRWHGVAAASRLYAITMSHLEPQSPNGRVWDVEVMQEVLSKNKIGEVYIPWLPDLHGQQICGRVLWAEHTAGRLVPPPSDLLTLPDAVLDSHAITREVREAYRAGDYAQAGRLRGEHLKAALGCLVERYASAADHDRPPIQSILEGVV